MELIDLITKRTTAATDVILALTAAGCVLYLRPVGQHEPWKKNVWSWAFGLLALSAALGAVAHGFKMSPAFNNLLWQPLNLSLGLTVALFAVGVVYDVWGQTVARRVLPVMVVTGALFYAVTLLFPDIFLVFVSYEALVMLFAVGAYGILATRGSLEGARLMTAGILISIAAAAVQASESVFLTFIWQFDHNGIFHLVQTVAVALLAAGIRAALRQKTELC